MPKSDQLKCGMKLANSEPCRGKVAFEETNWNVPLLLCTRHKKARAAAFAKLREMFPGCNQPTWRDLSQSRDG